MYNFEIDRIVEIIKEKGYRVVSLQFPEGLRDYSTSIAQDIEEKTSALTLISSNPCYGACDLADEDASSLGAEALFHFGHAQLLEESRIPVYYIEVRLPHDFMDILEENIEKLPKRLGIVTTVQHLQRVKEVKDFLENRGFKVLVGRAKGRCKYDAQILGCSFSTAKSIASEVDAFLYLGSGDFHPLGVAFATGKPCFALDPLLRELRRLEDKKEKFLRQRYATVAKAKNAENFGIIVGEKKGQKRLALALEIKKKLEGMGKKAFLIHAREITPENFIYFRKLDALVNTACPRIVIEDSPRFPVPLLTPQELEIVLGERDSYEMDEF